jgi:hypothetical protein
VCRDKGRLSGRGYRSVFAAVLSSQHIAHRNAPVRRCRTRCGPSAASSIACLAHIGRGLRHFHSHDTGARSVVAGVPAMDRDADVPIPKFVHVSRHAQIRHTGASLRG